MPLGSCPSTRFGMLQLFTTWLVKCNVPYFLTYGTLLGAVREGSVISYTPDIDIAIPALWTDRVQKLLQNELPECFEAGLGGVNSQVFHLYTRSPAPERLQAASPLLPFLRCAGCACMLQRRKRADIFHVHATRCSAISCAAAAPLPRIHV